MSAKRKDAPPEGVHNLALPTFRMGEMRKSHKTKLVALRCPRKSCKGWFQISTRYLRASRFWSRPCPYCFRAALLPDALLKYRNTDPIEE